jgi:hypothetical protein
MGACRLSDEGKLIDCSNCPYVKDCMDEITEVREK